MTKKDYTLIAQVISAVELEDDERDNLINEFCYQLERDNPRFNAVMFKEAVNK